MLRSIAVNFALAVAIGQALIWILEIDEQQSQLMLGLVIAVLLTATYLALPRTYILASLAAPLPGQIEVTVGDIVGELDGVLVVGVSDRVDIDFPATLHSSTVLAQVWGRTGSSLHDLESLLWAGAAAEPGHPLPVGTVLALPVTDGVDPVLVAVFAGLSVEGFTRSSPADLLRTLDSLWAYAHHHHLPHLRIPLLGSGLGRSDLPRPAIFSLIASSYRFALAAGHSCPKLTIYIHPNDYDAGEFVLAENALSSVGFSTQS